MAVAAELGSAVLRENQQLKEQNVSLTAKVSILEVELEETKIESAKLVVNQERLQYFLHEAENKFVALQFRREEELKSYEDNDYERLNIINTLDA